MHNRNPVELELWNGDFPSFNTPHMNDYCISFDRLDVSKRYTDKKL